MFDAQEAQKFLSKGGKTGTPGGYHACGQSMKVKDDVFE